MDFNNSISCTPEVRETDAVFASEIAHQPTFDEGGGLTGFYCKYGADGKTKVHQLKIDAEIFLGLLNQSGEPEDDGYVPCSPEDQDLFNAC